MDPPTSTWPTTPQSAPQVDLAFPQPASTSQEDLAVLEMVSCEHLCRVALSAGPLAAVGQSALAPKSAQACFNLLLGVPYDGACVEAVRRLKCETLETRCGADFAVEQFLVLQACLLALPQLRAMPAPDSVKRQFCITCKDIASMPQPLDGRLALESAAFAELAQIVTLRRLHAGQCSFDVVRRMPIAWLLKAHPLDLPRVLGALRFGLGGMGPVVEPHINYWRASQIVLLKREHNRALWRIAEFVQGHPEIKGLITSSWLYGLETAENSPHLGWLRDFYALENATIVDAGPALTDAGFLVGNERRKEQYASGTFRPRETIILWARENMLNWARHHTELADDPTDRAISPALDPLVGTVAPVPIRRWRSGRWTVLDCRRLLYYNPRRYIVIILALPALLGAALVGVVWSPAAALLAFVALIACLWVSQYLFLQ